MPGYVRLRQICLVAPSIEPVVGDIADIMGLKVCYRDGNVAKYGLENALLPVDTILLEVVASTKPGTAAGRFIEKTGGRGGYMAIFCCAAPIWLFSPATTRKRGAAPRMPSAYAPPM